MLTQAPKGTKDLLPRDSYLWQWIEGKERAFAALAGYREARTPVFEHTELFLRGVGDTTDIVQKEMYTFLDKGGRSITLKPEGTAGAVRAMIEARLYADPMPLKLYYLNAPIFRYENPQSGRLREHHQFGMECFGGKLPTVEAELIETLLSLLQSLGLKDLIVHINSIGCKECRPKYHEALKSFLGAHVDELCPTCRDRITRNPLRVLDCKEEKCKAILKGAPSLLDFLCEGCKEHFEQLKTLLNARGIKYAIDDRIVRGLDYYTRTVFEILLSNGLALCGGGRYDNLVEELGGPETPAAGFGLGTERLLIALREAGTLPEDTPVCDTYVASIAPCDRVAAFAFTQELRKRGLRADCDHAGRSLKAQFKFADKLGARRIALIGGEEYIRGAVKVRDLTTREEKELPLEKAADIMSREEETNG